MAIRGILFDKDGTLLDFEASWSRVYIDLAYDLAAGDAERAEALMVIGGLDPVSRRIAAGSVLAAGNTVDIARAWFPTLDADALAALVVKIDGVFHANSIACSVALPGLAETLTTLTGMGLALGVATSDGTASARAGFEMLGVGALLPHVFGYDSVPQPKPAPDMVHAFADSTGLDVVEIAVVGDNRHDLHMARSAGAGAAIGVLSGNSVAADLAPLADAVLADIRDLPGWLHQNMK